jgi:SpoVK/Ycf46/Vps4 family AAA+-type ATPase
VRLKRRLDSEESEENVQPRSRKLVKTGAPPTPLKVYETPIKTIQTLIDIIDAGVEYANLPLKKLVHIRPELAELNGLVGMPKLKESILKQLLYYLQNLNADSDDYLHTVIYGKPGQGKTTVAKILGKMFAKIGILKRNIFIVAQREDLIAGYLGQTAIKTRALLEIANKGVLFIDEIYSLGDGENKDSFAKECIDTINLFLSEHKHEFMMIIAGYEKEIDECFFSQNQGLRRRFMWYHTIDEYSPVELSQIFTKKVKDAKWSLDVPSSELETIFKEKDKFKNGGGDIENFLTLCKINHGVRVFCLEEAKKKILTLEDLKTTLNEFNVKKEEKDTKPPPMMYL